METNPADLRLTPQRRAVLAALRASHDHPRAAEVFARVQAARPGIGAATVYRSLAHLVEAGHARELTFDNGASRYDANTHRHDHLVCEGCGRAVDVDVPVENIARRAAVLSAQTGFTVTSYDLRLRGRCPDCAPHEPHDL